MNEISSYGIKYLNLEKNLFPTFLFVFKKDLFGFFLLATSVMGTDSCGVNCFPYDGLISTIFGGAFPIITLIVIIGSIFAYLGRDFSLLSKLIDLGRIPILPFLPLVFLGVLIIHSFF